MESCKRAANFTAAESALLIDIVMKYHKVIENKTTGANIWKEKHEVWEKITNEFNSASGQFPRSTKAIRSKYEAIKKITKKKCASLKREQLQTSGGPCPVPLTPGEEKLLSLMPNSIIGLSSRFDSYRIEPEANVSADIMTSECEDLEFLEEEDCVLIGNLSSCSKNIEKVNIKPSCSITKIENVEVPIRVITNKHNKRKIDTECSTIHSNTPTGSDATSKSKIIKSKRSTTIAITQDNIRLKKEILELQKQMLLQEKETKSEIAKLTIGNLQLDSQIKTLTLEKMKMNTFYDD